MKLYRKIKATLLVTLGLVVIGTVLSIINSISKGAPIDFLTFGMVYSVLTYGFIALNREKKALDEEMN